MNNPVAAEENLYFEMETKDATYAGVYDDVVAPGAKQLPLEKQGAENSGRASTEPAHSCRKSDAVIVQRLLCMMTAVIIFCVLIAATTLVLALTAMSRNTSAADCTVVQGKRKVAFHHLIFSTPLQCFRLFYIDTLQCFRFYFSSSCFIQLHVASILVGQCGN